MVNSDGNNFDPNVYLKNKIKYPFKNGNGTFSSF